MKSDTNKGVSDVWRLGELGVGPGEALSLVSFHRPLERYSGKGRGWGNCFLRGEDGGQSVFRHREIHKNTAISTQFLH